MKVIFLDHDGVICLANNWGSRFKNKEGFDSLFDGFDSKALKVLNEILSITDAEIVVSSDWKHHCTLAQMQELYKIRGIVKSPIAVTGHSTIGKGYDYLEHNRQHEIKQWLSEHPEVTHWVAVDDLNMSLEFCEKFGGSSGLTNFVYTPNSKEGIKQTGVKEKILKFLNP